MSDAATRGSTQAAKDDVAARPATSGVHHVGLTVRSLPESRAFFAEVLGFETVGEVPGYPAAFVSDGTVMITLWQVADPEDAAPFDRKNVLGLHHLALRVTDPDALDRLHAVIARHPGAAIEFGPEPLGAGPTRHMMCTIPGGPRLELISPC